MAWILNSFGNGFGPWRFAHLRAQVYRFGKFNWAYSVTLDPLDLSEKKQGTTGAIWPCQISTAPFKVVWF